MLVHLCGGIRTNIRFRQEIQGMVMKDLEFYRLITRPRGSRFYMSIQGLTGMMVSMVGETDPRTNP
ncbi:hypothetical protein Hdeb2414_s0003g00088701 [Helianthus debilis subsp. tardiflorus]